MATSSDHIGYPNCLAMSRFGSFRRKFQLTNATSRAWILVHAGSDISGLNVDNTHSFRFPGLKHVNYVKVVQRSCFRRKRRKNKGTGSLSISSPVKKDMYIYTHQSCRRNIRTIEGPLGKVAEIAQVSRLHGGSKGWNTSTKSDVPAAFLCKMICSGRQISALPGPSPSGFGR